MTKRYDTAEIFRIMLADDAEESNMNTTTTSADTSSGMAAELLRDIQQRNYGAAETKARQLWNQLGREAKAMRKACAMIKASLDEIEHKIHQQRVAAAGQAGREVAARLEATRLAAAGQKPSCRTRAYKHMHITDPPCDDCGSYEHYEKHEAPDTFLQEMDYRIKNLEKTGPHSGHGQGMRAGFMYARAIYKGTRK